MDYLFCDWFKIPMKKKICEEKYINFSENCLEVQIIQIVICDFYCFTEQILTFCTTNINCLFFRGHKKTGIKK
jgi:hypothetical protein